MAASTGTFGRGVCLFIEDQTTPGVFIEVANITSISISGRSAEEIDMTTLCDTTSGGFRRLAQGFKDPGEISFSLHFDPSNTTHDGGAQGIEGLLASGKTVNWRIPFANTAAAWPFRLEGAGYISGSDISMTPDEAITADVTIRLSGAITIAAHP